MRRFGKTLGRFSEQGLRLELSKIRLDGVEVRQGSSVWYPASVIVERFDRLDREGIYLRGGDRMVGPFTAERTIAIIEGKNTKGFEARIGIDGHWIPAGVALGKLRDLVATLDQASSVKQKRAGHVATPSAPDRESDSGGVVVPETPSVQASAEQPKQVLQACTECNARLNVTRMADGKLAACPTCKTPFRVVKENAVEGVVIDSGATRTRPLQARPTPGVPVQGMPVRGVPVQGIPVQGIPVQEIPRQSIFEPGESDGSLSFDHVSLPSVPGAPPAPSRNPHSQAPQRAGDTAVSYGAGIPGGAGGAKRSTFRYVVPGSLITCWGLLVLLGCLVRGVEVVRIVLLDTGQKIAPEMIILLAVTGLIAFVFGIFLSIGGIGMVRQKYLILCQVVAIVAAIPCVGGVIFPFGIWACVSLLSARAKHDFSR